MLKVNELIEKMVEEEVKDSAVKEFLNKILILQLQHKAEGGGKWKLGKEFDRLIIEFTAKFHRAKK